MTVDVICAQALAGVPHGFLSRRGGVSTGVVAGLNVGTGSKDDPQAIAENRRRAVEAVLPEAKLVSVYQVHSADAVYVDCVWPHEDRPKADSMVTDRPGLLLGILTADCAPVLFADAIAGVVGAAHAGWRGALAGVTDSTIAAMEKIGAKRERIAAAIGPCIAQTSYEVDEDFRARFINSDPGNGRYFAQGPSGKPHFNLEAYVEARLRAVGIGAIEALHLDTYADADRFFSFRRSSHRHEGDYGRQISMVAIPN